MALHSKLGASSSHRWMNCPGSVKLIESLGLPEDDESGSSEHAARGTLAHWVGSECLENGKDAWEYAGHSEKVGGHQIDLTTEDLAAVQVYLDYIRGKTDVMALLVEHAFHVPEIHEQFWGTSDAALRFNASVEIVDYKHGVGVAVDAEHNTQLMQYAVGVLYGDNLPLDRPVRLTIVQPRAWHEKGTIRSWDTTVGFLMRWVEKEWKPAAACTEDPEAPLVPAKKWCHFCTAKDNLACPALLAAVKRVVAMKDKDMKPLSNWDLVELRTDAELARLVEKAAGDEIFRRLMQGQKVTGNKLVAKKADRVFKTEIVRDETSGLKEKLEDAIAHAFGDAAYDKNLKTPAAIEKLPGGKPFVKEWAYKPETGLTLAPMDDARPAVTPRTRDNVFNTAPKAVASDF